jgi:hypothetical protein
MYLCFITSNKMKTVILIVCLFVAFLIQGCVAYVEPAGGYYYREGFWYYRDRHGMERHEHGKYHHHEHDEQQRDKH